MGAVVGILATCAACLVLTAAPVEGTGGESARTERESSFALWAPGPGGPSVPVGVAVWTVARSAGGRTHQLDLRVPSEDARVLVVERDDREPLEVFREMRPGAGRSVTVQRTTDGELRRVVWSPAGVTRAFDPDDGRTGFLRLADQLARGSVPSDARVLDPLSNSWIDVRVEAAPAEAGAGGRRYELIDAEGVLVRWLRLGPEGVEEFGWQDGGLVARRIGAAEGRDLLERLRAQAAESPAAVAERARKSPAEQ